MKGLLAPPPGSLYCDLDFNSLEMRVWAAVSTGKNRFTKSPTGLLPRAPEWSRSAK